jgi:hypothetical protein
LDGIASGIKHGCGLWVALEQGPPMSGQVAATKFMFCFVSKMFTLKAIHASKIDVFL